MKSFLAWLYHWATVIGAILVGGASIVLQALDAVDVSGVTSFLSPEVALRVVTATAVIKGACVLVRAAHGLLESSND